MSSVTDNRVKEALVSQSLRRDARGIPDESIRKMKRDRELLVQEREVLAAEFTRNQMQLQSLNIEIRGRTLGGGRYQKFLEEQRKAKKRNQDIQVRLTEIRAALKPLDRELSELGVYQNSDDSMAKCKSRIWDLEQEVAGLKSLFDQMSGRIEALERMATDRREV